MILCLDQASSKTGAAILNFEKELVYYQLIDLSKMPKISQQDQANKRRVLIEKVDEIVKKYDVQQIVLTGIYQKSPTVFSLLAKVQGVLEHYCCINNLFFFSFYSDTEWLSKLGIVKKNRDANKLATKNYVLKAFPYLSDDLGDDIYDAIGVGCAYFSMFE
jgi:Holliday junction resolvasome RuvABC endonuclease subunit